MGAPYKGLSPFDHLLKTRAECIEALQKGAQMSSTAAFGSAARWRHYGNCQACGAPRDDAKCTYCLTVNDKQ